MVSKTDLLQKTSEYMDYISEHKKNIQKAWDEIRNATIGISLLQRPAILDEMSWRIKNHDDSKFSEEEFVPYRQHFYPVDGEDVDPAAFDRAWRTHYRRNDHHWQYWVDEDGDFFISSYSVDNKICAYLEMVCDWQAMSYVMGGNAVSYYESHKSSIQIEAYWREFLEEILSLLSEYLAVKNENAVMWMNREQKRAVKKKGGKPWHRWAYG